MNLDDDGEKTKATCIGLRTIVRSTRNYYVETIMK